jgi:hypothetical protein
MYAFGICWKSPFGYHHATLISPLKNVIFSNYKTLIVAFASKCEACFLRLSFLGSSSA